MPENKVNDCKVLDELKRLYGLVLDVLDKYSDVGASDTEPCWKLKDTVLDVAKGNKFQWKSVDYWELYDMPGANYASMEINKAVDVIQDYYRSLPITANPDVQKFIEYLE